MSYASYTQADMLYKNGGNSSFTSIWSPSDPLLYIYSAISIDLGEDDSSSAAQDSAHKTRAIAWGDIDGILCYVIAICDILCYVICYMICYVFYWRYSMICDYCMIAA